MLSNYPSAEAEPLILIVPGLNNSGPRHWQSYWERELPQTARVELGSWDDPHRNTWVNQLNLAIHKAGRPVILVAHSLACHVVAWWNEYERPAADSPVRGALLVAPPEVEGDGVDSRIARFAPVMGRGFPFPSVIAASRDDPYIRFARARRLARIWKSGFVDAGWIGHINADSELREWPFGLFLLRQLRERVAPLAAPLLRGRIDESLVPSPAGLHLVASR